MAGCPRCAIELPRVNEGLPTFRHPNGLITFRELRVGQILNLPDEWFHPAREVLPPTYYKILPHADGRTCGTLGDALGDFPELDAAVTSVAALAAMGDAAFTRAEGDAGSKIDAAVSEVANSPSPDASAKAKSVTDSTHWAWQRNQDLAAAIAAKDAATVTKARLDIQNALATALGNARLAILAHYPSASPTPASPELQAAAKAASDAIAADPNYCTSVTHPGTPVNAAVHKFKLVWNASQTPPVPIGTGTYETATTVALGQVLGQAPSACGAGQRPVPAPKPPPPLPAPHEEAVTPPQRASGGWSAGRIVAGVALLAAAAGGVAHLATRSKKASRQPVTQRLPGYGT